MEKNGILKTFETHDLYLASALKIHNFKLISVQKNNAGRGVFIFKDQPDREQYVRHYFSGELCGSLKNFANSWADLKALVVEMGIESNAKR